MISYLNNLGIVGALGQGKAAVCAALLRGDSSGMRVEQGWLIGGPARVGRVTTTLPEIPEALGIFRCRANRLLLAAALEIREDIDAALRRYGPDRVGVVIGTSTSGIAEGETAIAALERGEAMPAQFHYTQQEIGKPAEFLAAALGARGPAYVVSTACTSSAKALAAARGLLNAGVCDAVVSGGADSLCRLTINGFASLGLTTDVLCNPMSRHRRGINIGEGAALFLMTREPLMQGDVAVALLGAGESSDAYHISAPDPAGVGADLAIRMALADAAIAPGDIGYINLHGTATAQNDAMEAGAVNRLFGAALPCSSTKPLTGHTLGAAGAIEAGFCWLALSEYNTARKLPPHVWDGVADPDLPPVMLADGASVWTNDKASARRRAVMSNSFAFGGNNISLILGEIG